MAQVSVVSPVEAFETFKAYVGALERNDEASGILAVTAADLEALATGQAPKGTKEQLSYGELAKAESLYADLYAGLRNGGGAGAAAAFHNQVAAFLDDESKRLAGQSGPGVLSQRLAARFLTSFDTPAPAPAAPAAPAAEPATDATDAKKASLEERIDRVLSKWADRADEFYEEARVLRLVERVKNDMANAGPKGIVLEKAGELGNGFELRAAIDVLRVYGFTVTPTEVGFYHAIDRIEVRGKAKD